MRKRSQRIHASSKNVKQQKSSVTALEQCNGVTHCNSLFLPPLTGWPRWRLGWLECWTERVAGMVGWLAALAGCLIIERCWNSGFWWGWITPNHEDREWAKFRTPGDPQSQTTATDGKPCFARPTSLCEDEALIQRCMAMGRAWTWPSGSEWRASVITRHARGSVEKLS